MTGQSGSPTANKTHLNHPSQINTVKSTQLNTFYPAFILTRLCWTNHTLHPYTALIYDTHTLPSYTLYTRIRHSHTILTIYITYSSHILTHIHILHTVWGSSRSGRHGEKTASSPSSSILSHATYCHRYYKGNTPPPHKLSPRSPLPPPPLHILPIEPSHPNPTHATLCCRTGRCCTRIHSVAFLCQTCSHTLS